MMVLPERYSDATFAAYEPQQDSQRLALEEARNYSDNLRERRTWRRRVRRRLGLEKRDDWRGLYLVGPVGTGKTHLLAAMYNDLHPGVPCAFVHSSKLFRTTQHPEAYAREIALRYKVLCLDEVEIDDAANEARLVHTLRQLDKHGVVLLATSNVDPDKFLVSEMGNDRFRRFLNEEFRHQHKVIFVGGDDYRRRQARPGQSWIGPLDAATTALNATYAADRRRKLRFSFGELIETSIHTEHMKLVRKLAEYEAVYITGISIHGTDDALRLLRIVDDLYLAPSAPILYFSSDRPTNEWFDAAGLAGVERAIAEKFARTTSRLEAMAQVTPVSV